MYITAKPKKIILQYLIMKENNFALQKVLFEDKLKKGVDIIIPNSGYIRAVRDTKGLASGFMECI